MLNAERRDKILEVLGRDKRVLASEMAAQFGVSEDTITKMIQAFTRASRSRRRGAECSGATPRRNQGAMPITAMHVLLPDQAERDGGQHA